MTKRAGLFSGKVLKTLKTNLSADRYKWLRLEEAEPDFGAPTVDGAFIYSDNAGNRFWTTQLTTDPAGNLQTLGVSITGTKIESRNPTEPLEISGGLSGEVVVDSNLTVNGTISFQGGIAELNLAAGQAISIGGNEVLNETTLGPGIVNSSLETVGVINTGTWEADPIQPSYGGTGLAQVQENAVLIGQGAAPMKEIIGQPYQVLQVDATGQPIFTGLDYGKY